MIRSFHWCFFFLPSFITMGGCTSHSTNAVISQPTSSVVKSVTSKKAILRVLPDDSSIKLRTPTNNPTVDKNLRVSLVSRYMKEAERWYQEGGDVNTVSLNGQTLLSQMILRRDMNAITFLLLRKASVNQANQDQSTPLHAAVTSNQPSVVAMLLERNAQITPLVNGDTLIHQAVLADNASIVAMLLEKDGNTSKVYEEGQSLLHIATSKGNSQLVQGLLTHGADIHATYNNGVTPLHLAAARGKHTVVKLLLSRHADIKAKTKKKWTPLHHAARFGHVHIVTDLLASGASANALNTEGKTPLALAKQLNHQAVVSALASQTRSSGSGRLFW